MAPHLPPALGDDPDRLMLQDEMCAHLGGISVRTLRYWTANGTAPPSIRIGKHLRYRVGDYRAWLATRARDDARPAGTPAPAAAGTAA